MIKEIAEMDVMELKTMPTYFRIGEQLVSEVRQEKCGKQEKRLAVCVVLGMIEETLFQPTSEAKLISEFVKLVPSLNVELELAFAEFIARIGQSIHFLKEPTFALFNPLLFSLIAWLFAHDLSTMNPAQQVRILMGINLLMRKPEIQTFLEQNYNQLRIEQNSVL